MSSIDHVYNHIGVAYTCIFCDFRHDFETHTDMHLRSAPLPINPVKQYTTFKVGDMFLWL